MQPAVIVFVKFVEKGYLLHSSYRLTVPPSRARLSASESGNCAPNSSEGPRAGTQFLRHPLWSHYRVFRVPNLSQVNSPFVEFVAVLLATNSTN